MSVNVGRRTAVLVAATALGLLVGCGDTRIDSLSKDIPRDSALKVLNGSAADSTANVYRQETYIYNGRMINVLLYSKDGEKEASNPSVADSKLTPVVTVDGKVTGWGWTHYDSIATANNIPVREHK